MLKTSLSRRVFSFLYTPLLAVSFTCAAHAADATLRITDEVSHPLPSAVFGQFLERPIWGNEYGPEAVADAQGKLSPEVETHLVGMHTTLVRFPHGTDGDFVDWQDMIDLPGRPARPVTTGHKGDTVTNHFGFPEYFALADRMKWSTILVTNLRDALYRKKPLAEAAAHSAALVAYATRSAVPVRIAAVQVGNEGCFSGRQKPLKNAPHSISPMTPPAPLGYANASSPTPMRSAPCAPTFRSSPMHPDHSTAAAWKTTSPPSGAQPSIIPTCAAVTPYSQPMPTLRWAYGRRIETVKK